MWMRILLRTRLVGPVGGLFVIAVRFMVGRGCVLGARAVNGVGELLYFLDMGERNFGQVGYICVSSVAFGERCSFFL